jgi:hypothetical protein
MPLISSDALAPMADAVAWLGPCGPSARTAFS